MGVDSIAAQVKAEILKLQQVLNLLEGGAKPTSAKTASVSVPPAKPRRKMSAAGRRRIAAAQKARWAKIRAAKK
jgi:hypothetical protein